MVAGGGASVVYRYLVPGQTSADAAHTGVEAGSVPSASRAGLLNEVPLPVTGFTAASESGLRLMLAQLRLNLIHRWLPSREEGAAPPCCRLSGAGSVTGVSASRD